MADPKDDTYQSSPHRLWLRALVLVTLIAGVAVEIVAIAAALRYFLETAEDMDHLMAWRAIFATLRLIPSHLNMLVESSALGLDGPCACLVLLIACLSVMVRGSAGPRWIRRTILWVSVLTAILGTLALIFVFPGSGLGLDQELITEGAYHRGGAAILWWLFLFIPRLWGSAQSRPKVAGA